MVRLILHEDYNKFKVLEIDENGISCWNEIFQNGQLLSKEVSDDSLTIYNNLRVDSVIVSPKNTIIHLSN